MAIPKSKRLKKSAAWPLKSCSSDTVFAAFGWKTDVLHRQRYKSLLDTGQQLWQAVLHPLLNVDQDEVEHDIVRQLMDQLQPLMSWNVDITRSHNWKPLCKHVAYWSRRRYLASKAWRVLRLSQRRVSLRLVPTRAAHRRRRSEGRFQNDASTVSTKGAAVDEEQPQVRLTPAPSPSSPPWVAHPVIPLGRPQVPDAAANAWVALSAHVRSRRQRMNKCA